MVRRPRDLHPICDAHDFTIAVGWILALRKIGDTFDSNFFYVWNIVMTVLMCFTWTVLIIFTIVAFCKGKIFISPPEDIVKDSYLHQKLRRHMEDLELGRAHRNFGHIRYTSQTVTPQPRSPRSRSRSPSRNGSGETLARAEPVYKKFCLGHDGLETPESGMSTPRNFATHA